MEMSKVMALILAMAMVFTVISSFPVGVSAASMADETFFGKLDYQNNPGLSEVKTAVDKGDYETAKAELLRYFKARHEKGEITGFGVTEADENYGMAVLPMRNILTGPYEFDMWQTEFTVTSKDFTTYEIDVTGRVADQVNNGAVSFMLMAGEKQQFPVIVKSKEAGEQGPQLVVEYDNGTEGGTLYIDADNDTYISSGNAGTNYGSETDLYIKEDANGTNRATGTDTRRAYINFPLTQAANTTVTKATLVLNAAYAQDCTTGDKDVLVINIGDTTWDETEKRTWNDVKSNIFSYQNLPDPLWNVEEVPNADAEYHNVTARFWYGKPMAWEYLSYLDNPTAYNKTHPFAAQYPGEAFGPKLVDLMDAFATQMNYGFNRTLETGERLNRWVDIVDAFLGTNVFDDKLDEFVNILSFMWGDCNYLNGLNITDGGPWWSNWRIVANAGFFKAVEFLPELKDHDAFRTKVEGNVEWTLDNLYSADMSFAEAGPSYNAWCVKLFGDCIRAANMSGNPMSAEFTGRVKLAARNALESYFPDGWDSNIGDSNYRDQMYYFETLDKVFEGSDNIIQAYINGSDEGAEYLSSFYPSTNAAYMRTSWDPEKTVYVNFSNNTSDGHWHPDSNQVLMYAYGKPLLVDSGRYGYNNPNNSIYTELRYASAHNTVEASGVSMAAHASSAPAYNMRSTTNGVFDFAYSEQYGYPNTSHMRNVLFVKDGYAIVTDYVDGLNAGQLYKQNWHFMPGSGAEVDADNNSISTNFNGQPNITVINAGSDAATVEKGYFSADYGLVANSEYASFARTGKVVKFDTLLYPTKANESVDVTVTDLAENDNSKAALKLGGELNGLYYVKNTDESDGVIEDYETDAKMFWENGGDIALSGGKSLKYNGKTVIESPAEISGIYLSVKDGALSVIGENLVPAKDEETAVKLSLDGVTSLTLNGEAVELKKDAAGAIVSIASSVVKGDVEIDGKYYNVDVTGNNLVEDGGFEDENGDFSWGTWQTPSAKNNYEFFKNKCSDWFYKVNRDTNEAKLYPAADLKAENYAIGTRWNDPGADPSGNGSALCSLANFVPVKAGKEYCVTFDYKHKNVADAGFIQVSLVKEKDFNDGSVSYTPAPATTKWQTAKTVFTPEEDGFIYFHFRWLGDSGNSGNGPFWFFDNFSVAEATLTEVPDPYHQDTTVVVNYVDADGSDIQAPSDPEAAEPGVIYTAEAPQTIKVDGTVYLLNAAKSSLTAKLAKGENVLTAVYDKTQNSAVTVNYVDETGKAFRTAVEVLVPFGDQIDDKAIVFDKTIVDGQKAYIFKSADGLDAVSDGTPKTVTLHYETFDVETKTVSAVKSTTVAGTTGAYSNYSTTGESNIPARIMMDNRSTSSKNRFGVIYVGENIPVDALKVTMLLKELEAGGSYAGNVYEAYDASALGTAWEPTNLSGASITGEPVGTGSGSGTTVTFDLTAGINKGVKVFALKKTDNNYAIMGGTTTNVAPVITVVSVKSKSITEITAPADVEVEYAAAAQLPKTVKAKADGKEITLDIVSYDPAEIDTRKPGEVEVSAKVAVPEHYALADGVTDTVKFKVTVLPEPEPVGLAPYDGALSNVSGQNAAGVYKFGGSITRKATFDFDLTINGVNNTLIGINNSANMTTNNFFTGSSIFMLSNEGKLVVRKGDGKGGGSNDGGLAVKAGDKLHVKIDTDVEAKTFTFAITSASGEVLHSTTENYGYRTNVEALDCLVLVDNNNKADSCAVENFKIATSSFTPDVTLATTTGLRVLTDEETGGAVLGISYLAELGANMNLIEKAGFEYGAYDVDATGNYTIENTDVTADFEQLSTDQFRLTIKDIKPGNVARLYAAKPYVVIGGKKIYGETVSDSLFNALADSIVNGKGKKVTQFRLDAANTVLSYVAGNKETLAAMFPGFEAAYDKLFDADGKIKAAYAALGFSTTAPEIAAVELLDLESVNIEYVDTMAEETAAGDISADVDAEQVL